MARTVTLPCLTVPNINFDGFAMKDATSTQGYLEGHLLLAMPAMDDPRFERSVIYLCAHNADGAMGLVVNREIDQLSFDELMTQVGLDEVPIERQIRIHFGGPVETGRGFVLHSPDYVQEGTMPVDDGFSLTASLDILRDIAVGKGPRRCILALGYAGWGPGQLESEIQDNGWLHAPADPALVFDGDLGGKWQQAIAGLGIDVSLLTGQAGHA